MKKIVKTLLLVVGIILIGFGVYKMIIPETSVDIGIAEFEAQENEDAYITIGLGLVAIIIGFLGGKKAL